MKEVNFNSLKNIKAPQEWLDKAALIPEAGSRKKRAFPIYRAVAAASLVLVSAIAILLFIFFGDQSPIAVRKKDPHDVFSTEWVSPDNIPDDGFVPHLDTILPTFPRVAPTDAHGQPVTEVIPTEKNSSAPKPTTRVSPSQAASERKANPTQSAVAPTEESPAPTQAPLPTEPVTPTNSHPTQPPTQPYSPPGDTEFYGMFKLYDPGTVITGNYVEQEESLYCRIYDSSGQLIGDGIWFSPQREATILSCFDDGTVYAYYNPTEKGLSITEGVYEYVFYDIHYHELYRDVKFVF